jgi:hypothetical protein
MINLIFKEFNKLISQINGIIKFFYLILFEFQKDLARMAVKVDELIVVVQANGQLITDVANALLSESEELKQYLVDLIDNEEGDQDLQPVLDLLESQKVKLQGLVDSASNLVEMSKPETETPVDPTPVEPVTEDADIV